MDEKTLAEFIYHHCTNADEEKIADLIAYYHADGQMVQSYLEEFDSINGELIGKSSYVSRIRKDLKQGIRYNKKSIESLAKGYGITNKNLVKEYTELAIVLNAREIAHNNNLSSYEKYQEIVALYESQVNLSMRTSMSMIMQQYSTPAPISFLASSYVLSDANDTLYFEPSAGNGLLTIALPYNLTYVNELDEIRLENLKDQPFAKITNQDATKPFFDYINKFDGVVTNPPFGTLSEPIQFSSFKIKKLEHAMCIRALQSMKHHGKAALIIGGHTDWDEHGRIKGGANRIFLNYLYHHYNVEDIIPINGKKLYSRQGTSFNTRLILIRGRKETPEGAAPLKNTLHSNVVNSHKELWDRVFLENSSSCKYDHSEKEQGDSQQYYDTLPQEVKNILDSWDDNKELYSECRRIEKELESIGWSCDYGLDGQICDVWKNKANQLTLRAKALIIKQKQIGL